MGRTTGEVSKLSDSRVCRHQEGSGAKCSSTGFAVAAKLNAKLHKLYLVYLQTVVEGGDGGAIVEVDSGPGGVPRTVNLEKHK